MPLHNDAETVAASLESALRQTLAEIEVICVDDGSTDGTVAIIERFELRDSRVRTIKHEQNSSAFQARRTGIVQARAEFVLFLDGDDELAADAAQRALEAARASGADLVGFGVTVVENDGRVGGSYEQRLQPVHRRLDGPDVLRGLFPIDAAAQGQLWRYLFRTSVMRDAYALLPEDLVLPRVNDLPVMFLVAALARSYVSIEAKLYRYHFGRGGSGQTVDSLARAEFYASAIQSIDSIRPAVAHLAAKKNASPELQEAYDSARLSIIGYVTFQLLDKSEAGVVDAALEHLHTVAPADDIVRGAGQFYPRSLGALKGYVPWQPLRDKDVRSILIATSTLRTGGVSAVIASQAHYLRQAGYRVTVVARSAGSDAVAIPPEVEFRELKSRDLAGRLAEWARICEQQQIDVVIDHQILYTQYWPEFALAARAQGAATVGWIHNFVGRPLYDGTEQLARIVKYGNSLAQLITLSPLDVSYLKLRGINHVAYVPNPPSPLLRESVTAPHEKTAPSSTINLMWWGRLEQHTKQVTELISVGTQLHSLGTDFSITVVGPDWDDLSAKKFNQLATRAHVGDWVRAIGPRHGDALIREIDKAHAFVSTSIIEGYQLTIAEAQARGLPVFMYELPWLTLVKDNAGVVSVPQGDAAGLAREIADLARHDERYMSLSRASVAAAAKALDFDFGSLYADVVSGTLPREYSPEPTLEDSRQLLELMVFFAERGRRGRQKKPSGTPVETGARLWARAAPLGRKVLRLVPGLRPVAHRVKGWLNLR